MRLIALIWFTFLTFAAHAQALPLPNEFTCLPETWYGGGFEIFYVTKVKDSGGVERFQGWQYHQKTSSHGQLIGKPINTNVLFLIPTATNGSLEFGEFSNPWGDINNQVLAIPQNWNSGSINVESPLFINDISGPQGKCTEGRDPLLP